MSCERASHLYAGAISRGCVRSDDDDGESGSDGHWWFVRADAVGVP
jgi:hypothetical protein